MSDLNKSVDSSQWSGIVLLILLIIAGALYVIYGGQLSNVDTVPGSNADTSTAQSQQSVAEKITIKNSTSTDKGSGLTQVVGEATNNDSIQHSATLRATFYDAEGKILGTASGAINDIAPGETKTFSLITTDVVTGYASMKVQVDTLL